MLKGGDTASALQAGLPDIVGTFGLSETRMFAITSGAFSLQSTSMEKTKVSVESQISDTWTPQVAMHASYSNSIYGNSNTVQPPAIVLIAQIKY